MKKGLIPLMVCRFIALFLFASTFKLSADNYPITFNSFDEELAVTAVCNAQLTIPLDDMGQYTLDPMEVDNGSSSDLGSVNLALDITNLDCNDIGTPVLVTLTVTEDATGTTDDCTSTITVIDDLAPAVVCEDQTVDVGDGMIQSISPSDFISASSMDNCSPTLNAVFLDPFSGWIEEVSASSANLQDVLFADANNGWIVGNLGSIQHTNDGGATWTSQISGVNEELRSVYFADVNTGWAVGLNETILNTIDGGTTWSVINPPVGLVADFYSVFFLDLNNGYIGGSDGVLLKTTDGGNTWADQSVSLLVNKRDIFFTDANNGWIISQESILHTNDGGVSWNVQDPIVSNILRKLSFVDASNGWIVGDNGLILNTTDGGTTWVTQTSGVSSSLKDIDMFNATSGYVSGGNGTLLYTSDAGATWSPVSLPNTPTADLRSLSAIDEQEVTVIGFNSSIYSYFIGNVEENTLDFDCDDIGSQNIFIAISDDAGNTTNCSVSLGVGDDVDPVASCQSTSISLDETGNYTFDGTEIDNGSFDVCTAITFTTVPASLDCSMTGSQTVELTVVDERGNSASCSTTVNVVDDILPLANCMDLTVNLGSDGSFNLSAEDINDTSTDNCPGLMLSMSAGLTTYDCSNIGVSETVELTVEDASGNPSTCSALVTVVDGTAPVISCQDFTAEIGNTGSYIVQVDDVLSAYDDNCATSLNFTFSQTDFECADEGSVFVIDVTATDDFGNSSTCQSNLSIVDSVLPLMGCQNISVDLDQNGSVEVLSSSVVLSATDACTVSPVSPASVTFDCTEIGVNQVDFSVSDDAGNTQVCTVEITVEDNMDPEITCLQNLDVELDGSGNATIEIADVLDTSMDNCTLGGLSFTLDISSFDCTDVSNNNLSVELSATDSQNNTGVCSTIVNVIDDEVPVVLCQDITLTLDASGLASATVSQFIDQSSDNCTLSFSASPVDFSCDDSGTTVNVVAFDGANISSCTSIVNLVDNIPPSITCQDFDAFITDSNGYIFDENDVLLTAEDNCGIVDYQVSNTTFECDQVGNTVAVTLTAFDEAGLSDDCVFNISIFEEVAPLITCQDFTLDLDGAGNGTLQSSDVLVSATDNCGLIEVELSKETFDCTELGSNSVIITVSDQFDNESDCTVNVEVVDVTAPSISCLQTVDISLDPVTGTVTIDENNLLSAQDDNCGILSITLSEDSFNCLDETVDVTVTATDASMNVSNCISSVVVQDVTAPVIFCQDYTLEIPVGGFAGITEADVVSSVVDNCVTYDLDFSTEFFECSSLGNNVITVTATDNAGNVATCTSTVFVVDLIAPEAVCQAAIISLDQNGVAAIAATDVDAGSADNCDELILNLSQAIFNCDDLGENTVTLTVIDGSGLQDDCSAVVTVVDESQPTVNCVQAFQLILDSDGLGVLEVSDVNVGSSDNCTIVSESLSQVNFDCDSDSPQQVTLTMEDQSQNSDQCTTLVSIADNTAPDLVCISSVFDLVLDPAGFGSIQESDVILSNTDNCGIEEIQISQTDFNCEDIGSLTEINISSEDPSGNTSSCTVQINVIDDSDPVFSCQDISVDLDANGFVSISPNDLILGVFEPCGISNISVDFSTFDCDNVGSNPVIVSVTDISNNTAFCFATVTVSDATPPVVECQNIELSLNFGGMASIVLEDVFISAVDNCGVDNTVLSQEEFNCAHVGVTPIEVLSTDIHGNVGSCIVEVTVNDNIPAAVLCPNSTMVLLDGDCSYLVEDFTGDLDVLDNCTLEGEFIIQQSPVVGELLTGAGSTNLIFTVEDINGNINDCTTNLILSDNTAPVIVCNDISIALDPNGTVILPLASIGDGSFDNCTSDLEFSTSAPLSYDCSDIGPLSIVLTASDEAGNSTSCTANLELVDATAPVVTCSPFTVILDNNGLAVLDEPTLNTPFLNADDACGIESINYSFTEVDCEDIGPNPIDVIVLDIHGNEGVCTTTLTVEDNLSPFLVCAGTNVFLDANGIGVLEADDLIILATDACGIDVTTISETLFTCDDIGNHLITVSVFDPFGNESSCEVDVDVEDKTAPEVECMDVIIELPENGPYLLQLEEVLVSVEDACSDDVTFEFQNLFTCANAGFNTISLQAFDEFGNLSICNLNVIVIDNEAPEAVCTDVTVDLDESGNAVVSSDEYAILSIDNCSSNLFVSPSEINLNCSNIGPNSFEISVTDSGGQSDNCNVTINVNEIIPPVLMLQDTLNVFLDADGNALVLVEDFDLGTTDNCTFFNLSFGSSQEVTELVFDCDDAGFIDLEVWATDGELNQSMQEVVLIIIESGACDPTIEEVTISGNIAREDGVSVPDALVELSNGFSQLTDADGNYSFIVLADSSYAVVPARDGDYLNGVTTFDIALIQSVILGLSSFDSPYKYIAADVNNSGNISTFDILLMQKNILGLDNGFINNSSWRFVDAGYVFSDPFNPWIGGPFSEAIDLTAVDSDEVDLNFVAVKIGDVNLSSDPFTGNEVAMDRNKEQLIIELENQKIESGSSISIQLDYKEIDLIGGQLEFVFDPAVLELSHIDGTAIASESYVIDAVRGSILISFVDFDKALEDTMLNLEFNGLSDGVLSDVIALKENNLSAELISRDMEVYGLDFVFKEASESGLSLTSVSPNPFSEQVRIAFDLDQADEIELIIRDQSGVIVRNIKSTFEAGAQFFILDNIDSKGLLLFELRGSRDNVYGKMIKQ